MPTPLEKITLNDIMGSPIDSSFAHISKLDQSINIFMELQANDKSTG